MTLVFHLDLICEFIVTYTKQTLKIRTIYNIMNHKSCLSSNAHMDLPSFSFRLPLRSKFWLTKHKQTARNVRSIPLHVLCVCRTTHIQPVKLEYTYTTYWNVVPYLIMCFMTRCWSERYQYYYLVSIITKIKHLFIKQRTFVLVCHHFLSLFTKINPHWVRDSVG